MSWSSRRGCCVYFMERSFPAPLPALLSVPARISGPSVKHHQSPDWPSIQSCLVPGKASAGTSRGRSQVPEEAEQFKGRMCCAHIPGCSNKSSGEDEMENQSHPLCYPRKIRARSNCFVQSQHTPSRSISLHQDLGQSSSRDSTLSRNQAKSI